MKPFLDVYLRQGHKKEIREREETIADKEKRIYDLKKKNQEVRKTQTFLVVEQANRA